MTNHSRPMRRWAELAAVSLAVLVTVAAPASLAFGAELFLGWRAPDDRRQITQYARYESSYHLPAAGAYEFRAVLTATPPTAPRVRLTLQHVDDPTPRIISDWQTMQPYRATVDLSTLLPGSWLLGAETEPQVEVLQLAIRIGDRGPGPQWIWVTSTRFDIQFGRPNTARKVWWPGAPAAPATRPLAPRPAPAFSELLTSKDLWADRLVWNTGLVRRFANMVNGDVAVAMRQQYFYEDRDSTIVPLYDGPRGIGTIGHPAACREHPQGAGWYCLAVNGRVFFAGNDGRITTLFGPRVRPGENEPYWAAGRAPPEGEGAPGARWRAARLEHVGLMVKADGTPDLDQPSLSKPWDLVALPWKDTPRGFHEWLVTDTRNDRIVAIHHSHRAEVPTLGYTAARLPHPWGLSISPIDGRLYVTCELTGEIYSFDPPVLSSEFDTARRPLTGQRLEFRPARIPTDAQLGVGRYGDTGKAPSRIRAEHLVDGAFGVATIGGRLQGIRFLPASMGHKAIVSERYSFVLREVDFAAKHVTTIAVLPTRDSGAGRSFDVTIDVDVNGVFGPAGDIVATTWHQQSGWRFSATGTLRGPLIRRAVGPRPLLGSGPADRVDLDYAWGWTFGSVTGRMFIAGGGKENAFILSRRRPEDPTPDLGRYHRGVGAWRKHPAAVTQGTPGHGYLGDRSWDELSTMRDEEIDAHLGVLGFSAAVIPDIRYAIRWHGVGAAPAPPPLVSTPVPVRELVRAQDARGEERSAGEGL